MDDGGGGGGEISNEGDKDGARKEVRVRRHYGVVVFGSWLGRVTPNVLEKWPKLQT